MDSTLAQREDYYGKVLNTLKEKAFTATTAFERYYWENFLKYVANQKVAKTVRGTTTWFSDRKGKTLVLQVFRVTPEGEFQVEAPVSFLLKSNKWDFLQWDDPETGQVMWQSISHLIYLSSSADSITFINDLSEAQRLVVLFHQA